MEKPGLAGHQGGVEEKHEDDAGRYFTYHLSEVDENYVLCRAGVVYRVLVVIM